MLAARPALRTQWVIGSFVYTSTVVSTTITRVSSNVVEFGPQLCWSGDRHVMRLKDATGSGRPTALGRTETPVDRLPDDLGHGDPTLPGQ